MTNAKYRIGGLLTCLTAVFGLIGGVVSAPIPQAFAQAPDGLRTKQLSITELLQGQSHAGALPQNLHISSGKTESGSGMGVAQLLQIRDAKVLSEPYAPTDLTPPATPTPVPTGPPPLSALRSLDSAHCARGMSLNIVAHQDDDLLFLNPDVQHDIAAQRCVRTVYLTAGDAGSGPEYWNSRERGSEAAYAAMYNLPSNWHTESQIVEGKTIKVAYLSGAPEVSLIFLRLPDGNINGSGFSQTRQQSLEGLFTGKTLNLKSVDSASEYTKDDLVALLSGVMLADEADTIRTQHAGGLGDGDHSDHHATGEFTLLAAQNYLLPHVVTQYMGYPMKTDAMNLTNEQIANKLRIFMSYAAYDGAVCHSGDECGKTETYGRYLTRQYHVSSTSTVPPMPSVSDSPATSAP